MSPRQRRCQCEPESIVDVTETTTLAVLATKHHRSYRDNDAVTVSHKASSMPLTQRRRQREQTLEVGTAEIRPPLLRGSHPTNLNVARAESRVIAAQSCSTVLKLCRERKKCKIIVRGRSGICSSAIADSTETNHAREKNTSAKVSCLYAGKQAK